MFLNSNSCDSILTVNYSYFVTELLGTDLHRLLTSRPLEKQFIQYFLYQILVCHLPNHAISVPAHQYHSAA